MNIDISRYYLHYLHYLHRPRALYSGIVPGLQRQMAFSAIRIGGYEQVKEQYMAALGVTSGPALLGVRVLAGLTTGDL